MSVLVESVMTEWVEAFLGFSYSQQTLLVEELSPPAVDVCGSSDGLVP